MPLSLTTLTTSSKFFSVYLINDSKLGLIILGSLTTFSFGAGAAVLTTSFSTIF